METKQILGSATQLNQLRNGEHYQHHENILGDVTEEIAEAHHFAPQRLNYMEAFRREDVVYKQNQGYLLTKDIVSKDRIRDEVFYFLRGIIDTHLYSQNAEKKKAAELLSFIIKPYRMAVNLSYTENTAEISKLIKVLKQEENAPSVTMLELDETVASLEEANTDFNTTYNGRSTEKLTRKSQYTMKKIRPEVDAAYTEMANAINVLYQANELAYKDEETRTVLGGLIDKINTYIIDINDRLLRRGSGTKTDTTVPEPTPEESEEPVKLEITAVYSKVKDPYDAMGITRGKETLMEWTGGFELVNEKGDGPGKIVVIAENSSIEEIVPAEDILARSNKGCEFIMIRDFAEGNYKIRIETYHEGKPLSLEYAKIIKLV